MMSCKQWFVLLGIYILFMLGGAVVFLYLEVYNELAEREDLASLKTRVIDVVSSLANTSRADVEEVMSDVGDTCGHDFLHQVEDEPLTWSLWNSFFFTFTVITTIGFGHMSPATPWGRVFCIAYAIIGVPLNGILIASLADLFASRIVNSQVRARAKRYESWVAVAADTVLYLVPGFLVFLVLPAAVLLSVEEGWNYLDSFYFAFITLTTIGFGDYVAGLQETNHVWVWVYKIVMVVWIIFGLGYIIMSITFIQTALKSKRIHNIERKLAGALKKRANKVNHNLHKDLKRMRKVVNTMVVLGSQSDYYEDDGGHDDTCGRRDEGEILRRTRSHCSMRHRTRSRSPSRLLQHKMSRRSASDAALNAIKKDESCPHVAPLSNVTVFLDMVESLIREHEAKAAQTAEHDARNIIREDSTSQSSDAEFDRIRPAETSPSQDVEMGGYINKAFVTSESEEFYERSPKPQIEDPSDEDSKRNDRIQKKLSILLAGKSRQDSAHLAMMPQMNEGGIKTASEMLEVMECLVGRPWTDCRVHDKHSNPNRHTYQRLNSHSFPGRIKRTTGNCRPDLSCLLHATPDLADSSTCSAYTTSKGHSKSDDDHQEILRQSSIDSRRSFGSDSDLYSHYHHNQIYDFFSDSLSKNILDDKESENERKTRGLRLLAQWFQSDSGKRRGHSLSNIKCNVGSAQDIRSEYTHL